LTAHGCKESSGEVSLLWPGAPPVVVGAIPLHADAQDADEAVDHLPGVLVMGLAPASSSWCRAPGEALSTQSAHAPADAACCPRSQNHPGRNTQTTGCPCGRSARWMCRVRAMHQP